MSECNGHAESKDGKIDLDCGFVGKGKLGQQENDHGQRSIGEQHTQHGSREGKDEGFRQELTDNAAAACAHGGANGEFVLARRAAGEKQDRNISTSDDEQQGYGTEEQIERATKLLNKIFIQSDDMELKLRNGEMLRSFFGELLDEGLEGGVGGFMGNSGLQSKSDIVGLDGILRNFQREVDVAVVPSEARGGDTDDGVVLVNQLQSLPEYCGVGVEVALPELVAEDGDGLRILAVDGVGGNEAAPEGGRNAHEVEAVGGHVDPLHVFGKIVAGDGETPIVGDEGIFDGGSDADALPLRGGQAESHVLTGLVANAHVDHAVWGSVRIRIHEDGVDDAEDRRGGADAKGEGEDGGESESGMVAELAEGEAEIGKHGQSSPMGRWHVRHQLARRASRSVFRGNSLCCEVRFVRF